jgi:putative ABC transport system permease protein
MKIFRNLLFSIRALSTRKLRTGLSLLGMSIGVAAVIMMTAMGSGARKEALAKIEKMGTNLLVVQAGRAPRAPGRARQEDLVTTLKLGDWEAFVASCPSVAAAAPTQEKALKVTYADVLITTNILGSTPDYPGICNSVLGRGRLFTDDEDRTAVRLAVLGSQTARNLFGRNDPLGETIRIRGIPFRVIGVLKEKGVGRDGANEDDKILIPIRTALRRVFNLDYIKAIFVRVRSREAMAGAETEARAMLRDRHRLDRNGSPDDFTIQNQLTVLEAAETAGDSFTALIAGVAAVSLVVGGIGILAVMTVAVKERTPEIGLRMAVGSRPRDILVQFLAEALVLGLSGGAVGAAIGLAGSWIIGAATSWETAPAAGPAVFSVLFSLAVGLLFGAYPARKASLLDPIKALRAE